MNFQNVELPEDKFYIVYDICSFQLLMCGLDAFDWVGDHEIVVMYGESLNIKTHSFMQTFIKARASAR